MSTRHFSIRMDSTLYDGVLHYATESHRTFSNALEYLLKSHPGLRIEGEPETHVASRAGVVGGATAKSGSTPDSGTKLESLLSNGSLVRGSQLETELRDAEPVEFGDVDFEPEPPEPDYIKPETKLTFDDLGDLKVRIKCWCMKLMKADGDDAMACPSGHRQTLIELRRDGKL